MLRSNSNREFTFDTGASNLGNIVLEERRHHTEKLMDGVEDKTETDVIEGEWERLESLQEVCSNRTRCLGECHSLRTRQGSAIERHMEQSLSRCMRWDSAGEDLRLNINGRNNQPIKVHLVSGFHRGKRVEITVQQKEHLGSTLFKTDNASQYALRSQIQGKKRITGKPGKVLSEEQSQWWTPWHALVVQGWDQGRGLGKGLVEEANTDLGSFLHFCLLPAF